jgi:membrane peptidoglycan carboxypeptidase
VTANPAMPPAPRIFVSYRRNDAPGYALRVHDALVARFGDDHVFLDVDDIRPGRDFTEVLAAALDRTDVMLALIGPDWLKRQAGWRRRIDNPDDFVRRELLAALDRGVPIIPVLLRNAAMPSARQLPAPLVPLATIQAFELSDRSWRPGLTALVGMIEQQAAAPRRPPKPVELPTEPMRKAQPRRRRRVLAALSTALVLPIVIFVLGWMMIPVPTIGDEGILQVAHFTYADGTPLSTLKPTINGRAADRAVVTIDHVPTHVRQAVIATEDPTFFSNPGFTLFGSGDAGGPTITEQYVTTSLKLDETSVSDQFRRFILAIKISKEQTKDQILENYLNTAYFGRGAYGVEAAAQSYFGKDVGQLSIAEGALLAAIIHSPLQWDPAENPDKAGERWNTVLDDMVRLGYLPPAERAAQQFPSWRPRTLAGQGIPDDDRGALYARAVAELQAMGISDVEIRTGGLTVTLTIDGRLQEQTRQAVGTGLRGQPDTLRSAVVAVDPRTGAVLAYYGGARSSPDYADAERKPGSTFAPFVVASALQNVYGFGLGTRYAGTSPLVIAGTPVLNSEGESCTECSVKTAMTKSTNTVFTQIATQVGATTVAQTAHSAGIPANLLPNPTGGLASGDKPVHVVDMAMAYATFAADGQRSDPHIVQKAVTADGRVLLDRGTTPVGQQAVFPRQLARNVTESMIDVAATDRLALSGGRPVAAKSGTAQTDGRNTDAWYVGYTPSVVTAVWVGADGDAPILTAAGATATGRGLAGPIWQRVMNAAHAGTRVDQFSPFEAMGTP